MNIPDDNKDVYAAFGFASETAQCLELEAGNVALAYIAAFVGVDNITPEETHLFAGLVDDLNRRTLGNLLNRVKKLGEFDDSILSAVDEALERRNYLTHHFFRTHNFAIFSDNGRATMIAELNSIQSTLERARLMLSGVAGCLLQLAGQADLSPEMAAKLTSGGKSVKL